MKEVRKKGGNGAMAPQGGNGAMAPLGLLSE